MKYLKTFNEAKVETVDFHKEVKKLDKEMSKGGVTCDSDDVFKALVKKHGKKNRAEIKKAVDEFYKT